MRITDLTEDMKELYFVCLDDWSDEFNDAGDYKVRWYEKMKDRGLRVKVSLDDSGEIGGLIQYAPIEHSFVDGKDLYFVYCIWVHGHKKGRGNFQGKGMGKALLEAAEQDVNELGAKGLAVWGIPFPFWMKASWFKKQGYQQVDKNGLLGERLLWKKFKEDAEPPRLIKDKKKPQLSAGRVTVTAFRNGWCPVQNIMCERAKRACAEIGDKAVYQEIETFEKESIFKWGCSDVLYVDDKRINNGPPLSYEKIKKKIEKKAKGLPR